MSGPPREVTLALELAYVTLTRYRQSHDPEYTGSWLEPAISHVQSAYMHLTGGDGFPELKPGSY